MNTKSDPETSIRDLFAAQDLAVLATAHPSGHPHTSLVAVAASDDLSFVLFSTGRDTGKFRNMAADPRVAMLMDNRSHSAADVETALAVTAIGSASEVHGQERSRLLGLFLARHPHMEVFATGASTALLKVAVDRYQVVRGIHDVSEVKIPIRG